MAWAPPANEIDALLQGGGLTALTQAAHEAQALDDLQPEAAVPAAPQAPAGEAAVPADPKQISADMIKPGCAQYIVTGWKPGSAKPEKKHLIAAMKNRQLHDKEKEPQANGWPVQKIADWLHTHELKAGVLVELQAVPQPANAAEPPGALVALPDAEKPDPGRM